MVGSPQVLTVSYGDFSCTLEGFEDAVGTLQTIVDYFRGLAAEEAALGAARPLPDAATLQQVAERALRRRIDASDGPGGITLRPDAASSAGGAAPEDTPAGPCAPRNRPAGPPPAPPPGATVPAPSPGLPLAHLAAYRRLPRRAAPAAAPGAPIRTSTRDDSGTRGRPAASPRPDAIDPPPASAPTVAHHPEGPAGSNEGVNGARRPGPRDRGATGTARDEPDRGASDPPAGDIGRPPGFGALFRAIGRRPSARGTAGPAAPPAPGQDTAEPDRAPRSGATGRAAELAAELSAVARLLAAPSGGGAPTEPDPAGRQTPSTGHDGAGAVAVPPPAAAERPALPAARPAPAPADGTPASAGPWRDDCSAPGPGGAVLDGPLSGAEDEARLTRLIAATEERLKAPEDRRRRSAIAHLRAAVAATRAEGTDGDTGRTRDATADAPRAHERGGAARARQGDHHAAGRDAPRAAPRGTGGPAAPGAPASAPPVAAAAPPTGASGGAPGPQVAAAQDGTAPAGPPPAFPPPALSSPRTATARPGPPPLLLVRQQRVPAEDDAAAGAATAADDAPANSPAAAPADAPADAPAAAPAGAPAPPGGAARRQAAAGTDVPAQTPAARPCRDEHPHPFRHVAAAAEADDLEDLLLAAARYLCAEEARAHFTHPDLWRLLRAAVPDQAALPREVSLRAFAKLQNSGRILKIQRGRFTLSQGCADIPDLRRAMR